MSTRRPADRCDDGGVVGSGAEPLVYRPTFVRALAAVVWSGVAVSAVMVALDDAAQLLRWLPPLALLALGVHVLFWRPAVVVDDEAVLLRNLVRDVRVPWQRLEAVDTRFALTLHTDAGRFVAWAAPAPGRLGTAVARRDTHGLVLLGGEPERGVSASAGPGSDSGGAALMVRLRWQQTSSRPGSPGSPGTPHGGSEPAAVAVRWSRPLLLALLLAAAASAAALLA